MGVAERRATCTLLKREVPSCSGAREHGDGWRLPGGDGQLNLWGLKPGTARDFVRTRLCDFSLRCFEERLRLPAHRKGGIPATFVSCVAEEYPARPFFQPFAEKARASGWKVAQLETGHDCHVESPGEVVEILLSTAMPQRTGVSGSS